MAYFSVKDALGNVIKFLSYEDGSNQHVPYRRVWVRNTADDANIDPVAEATFTGRMGEVQAAPTSNTVLARLKDLLTGIVLAAGSAVIGKVQLDPGTSGGLSIYRKVDLDETGQNAKAGAGQVYGWAITNAAASARFVKLYNKATAPSVGTDAVILTLRVEAGTSLDAQHAHGIPFATGIGVGATTGVADNDTGAPDANDVICHLFYK
jgi:hypothetical protein